MVENLRKGKWGVSRTPFHMACDKYEQLIRSNPIFQDDKCPREVVESEIQKLPTQIRPAFIFLGAIHARYGNRPSVFEEIAREVFSYDEYVDLAVACFTDLCQDDPRSYTDDMVIFIEDKFGHKSLQHVLHRIVKEAPDDSPAYVRAAIRLIADAQSSVAMDEFRKTWTTLSPKRREAIGICYRARLWGRIQDGRAMALPDKLESIVRETDFPASLFTRPRWIDAIFPTLRGVLWQGLVESDMKFASETRKLGGEREQVGSLLTYMLESLRNRTEALKQVLKTRYGASGRLRIDRYIFKTREEKRWGPDFALVFLFRDQDGVSVARYVLFQAKLVEKGGMRIPTSQLRTLLRSSWHSSFYVAWEAHRTPYCIPAPILASYIQALGKSAVTPQLRWPEIVKYADRLADLLSDRFLCGELGDPLLSGVGGSRPTGSDIANHLYHEFGCDEVLFGELSVQKGEDEASVHIALESHVVELE